MNNLSQTILVKKLKNSWKEKKSNHHSMHDLCSRICSFPPSIPEYYIKKYSNPGDVVFDPWAGKGTVPFEAIRNGRMGIGNDKSPEAFILTHAKIKPVNKKSFEKYVYELEKKMNRCKITSKLTYLDKRASVFYSKKTFEQILKLKKVLLNEKSHSAIFTKAIILGLLHGSTVLSFSLKCSHSYAMSPPYVQKYTKEHGLRKPYRDVINCILEKGFRILENEMPKQKGIATNTDSRKLKISSNSVDMILTSPPYFDVQTYAWANWLRLWFLNYDYKQIKKELAESGDPEIYRNFMNESIKELFRVLRPGSRCFIVVGDVFLGSGKYRRFVNTANFLKPSLIDAGFKIEKFVLDEIPQIKKVNSYVGKEKGIKKERIIYLIKPKN